MPSKQQKKQKGQGTVSKAIRKIGAAFNKHPLIFTICLAVALALLTEILGRHSLWQAMLFVGKTPVRFLVNVCIIFFTLSLSFLFPKRSFFIILFSAIWLALGIVNCILLGFRTTPLGIIDIALLSSVSSIIHVYLDTFEIVLVCAAAVLILGGLMFVFIKAPKQKVNFKSAVIYIVAGALSMGATYGITVISGREVRSESFSNIAQAYKDYGFVYCFCTGAVDRGIKQPKDYSYKSVKNILSNLDSSTDMSSETPDIIMIQLESFFDVNHLDDVECDENPIPVFTKLKEEYSSGYLTVPSVGAGTANTEFEVLSGMSLDYFGMGEYPYKTILQQEACETVATNLEQLGYTSHAVHNNTGTFYGRDEVYAQLGFETFTPIEYMQNVTYNPIGWAKDKILTGEIIKALDSTAGKDFVFTVSVQGHGKYQRGVDSEEAEALDVTWEDDPADEDAFAYYVSQIHEMDQFIGELIDTLEERGEPTVVVLYGDHLPNFSIGSDQLDNGDIFQTEYVIWNNFGLECQDKDLYAYQLSAQVLGDLGIDKGILTKYHQQCSQNEDYKDGLKLLEYDMLYGRFYCYGGSNAYKSTDLQMGVEPITISDVTWKNGMLYVRGENFTDWSTITINGNTCDTLKKNNGLLYAETDELKEGDVITIRQITANYTLLSESAGYTY